MTAVAVSVGAGLAGVAGFLPAAMDIPTALGAVLLGLALMARFRERPASASDVQRTLGAGIAAIILLLIVLGTMAYLGLTDLRESQRAIVARNLATVYEVMQLRVNLNSERLDVASMLQFEREQWAPWEGTC